MSTSAHSSLLGAHREHCDAQSCPRLSRGQILRFEQHAKACGNKRACRHTDQGARRRIQSLPPARRRRHSRLRHERTQIARRIIADSMFSRSQGQTVTDRRCSVQVSCASQSRRSHERKLKIRIQRERPSATDADKTFEILTTCDQSEDSTAGLKSNSESLPCAAGSCALKEAHVFQTLGKPGAMPRMQAASSAKRDARFATGEQGRQFAAKRPFAAGRAHAPHSVGAGWLDCEAEHQTVVAGVDCCCRSKATTPDIGRGGN
jgi:hypothetical protein